jgi:hypothetical protein
MARNYRKEYDNYHGSDKQKKRRAKRNAARRKMERNGKVSKGDGKDVAHKDNNPNNNSSSNLKAQSKSKNRSFARTKTARRKKKTKSYNEGGKVTL